MPRCGSTLGRRRSRLSATADRWRGSGGTGRFPQLRSEAAVRTETFATPGSVRLKVSIPSGEIRLETSDEPETHVELEARDEEALAAATIEVRERGGGHEVVVEAPKKFRLLGWGNGNYRLYIRAPHGADVNLSTSS